VADPQEAADVVEIGITPRNVTHPKRLIFEAVDTSHGPVFSVGEAARIFFGQKPEWLRWQERQMTGTYGFRNASQMRQYSLADVELLAHALCADRQVIGEIKLAAILLATKALAISHGLLCHHSRPIGKCTPCKKEAEGQAKVQGRKAHG
jgi:hypothetical protein